VSRRRLLPGGLLVLVLLLDAVVALTDPPLVLLGLLDEPAHLATAGLALLVVRPARRAALLVLLGSVLIDADHVPLYLGVPHVAAAGGRPLTHCLLTVAVLLVLGASARLRPVVVPLAAGVGLHLVRDLATGPGVPLLWPAGGAVLLPYGAYAAVLACLALAATLAVPQSSSRRRR
jgi:inner membrane protein